MSRDMQEGICLPNHLSHLMCDRYPKRKKVENERTIQHQPTDIANPIEKLFSLWKAKNIDCMSPKKVARSQGSDACHVDRPKHKIEQYTPSKVQLCCQRSLPVCRANPNSSDSIESTRSDRLIVRAVRPKAECRTDF